jgi:hypothetical protein
MRQGPQNARRGGPKDTKARYQLGALVKAAQDDPDKYGKRAVQQLATTLGYDKATLSRDRQIADHWSLKELSDLLRQKGVTGTPIGFTHLMEIARVKGKRRRQTCVEAVLGEGLSLRALKRRIGGEAAQKARHGDPVVR